MPAERTPKLVFVLGAGASLADGVPLQPALLPYIRAASDPALSETAIGQSVRSFLDRWFGMPDETSQQPALEEVFAFLDTLIEQREDLSDAYPLRVLESTREALVKCIHYAIHSHQADTPKTYRAFWRRVASSSADVSVVTLNYDSALEEAFDPLYPAEGLLDYCLPLMNYDSPEKMDGFNWWIDPRAPRPEFATNAPAFRVVKLHGSLNWQYCRACREVMLTPWSGRIDLSSGRFVRIERASCFEPEERVFTHTCPYCACPFETLILPPAHKKELQHPIVSHLSREATRLLRAADRVVFVGYSFPPADIHVRIMLARSLANAEISVVNPALSTDARARYSALSASFRHIPSTFEGLIASGSIDELLRP